MYYDRVPPFQSWFVIRVSGEWTLTLCLEMPDSIDTLQDNLRQAQEAFYARRGKPFDSAAYDETHGAVLAAEVALAKARSEPYAVPIDVGFVTGREAPIVLCADHTPFLYVKLLGRTGKETTKILAMPLLSSPFAAGALSDIRTTKLSRVIQCMGRV